MKRTMLKIWSLTMVMVVAVSTSGFAINKHYCGGKEKAKALFLEAEKCAFEYKRVCLKHHENSIDRKDCCEDKASFFKQILTVDLDVSQADSQEDLYGVSNLHFELRNINILKSEKLVYTYRPPPIERDLHILFESFLL